jgi:hypothetical protein
MMKGLAVLALLLSGCDLYFGGGDDVDPPCYGTGGGQKIDGQRDPSTGECQYDYGCIDSCECAYDDKLAPDRDWATCNSYCTNLDAQSCFVTPGCYAAYIDNPAADGRQFWGCWQTAPSGPIQGACANLDAWSCSRHDNCVAVYSSNVNSNATVFQACEPEAVAYCVDDTACGANSHCDTTVCYPSPTCPSCPTCGACPDSNTCYGICVPEPQACDSITCAPGYHCDQQCSGGNDCKPACVSDVTCDAVDCVPGYACAELCGPGPNGVLTCGPACVPSQPPTACSMLATEAMCIARADCVPVYDGDNCTCYPDHCECQVLTYDRCESL